MTTTEAGWYGGGKEITCVLNEGDISVAANAHIPRGVLGYSTVTLAAEVDKGDFVALDEDANNTYANTNGIPVVLEANATTGLWGIVKSEPAWYGTFPQTARTESSAWDTMLTNEEYRFATVEFVGVISIFKANIEGTTDVIAGAPLVWDLSLDAFKDNGTTASGAWALHANAAASNAASLVAVSHLGFVSGNTDCGGIDVVA
jgi:hypothetical protein